MADHTILRPPSSHTGSTLTSEDDRTKNDTSRSTLNFSLNDEKAASDNTIGIPTTPDTSVKGGKKPYLGMTGNKLNAWVSVACITAMTLFGYDQGVFGGIIVTPDFLQTMGNPNPQLQGTIVSLYDIGCFLGAMSTFLFGERLGRRKSLIAGVIVMTVGAVLQTAAINIEMMLVARVVTGLGNGVNTATSPVWQSETTKPTMRGKLIVFGMIMNIAGFSLSNWMTYGFSFLSGSISWRFPIAVQLLFSLVLLATVPWLPESPRWLLAHGHEQEGVAVLCALEGRDARPDDKAVIQMKDHILDALKLEREARGQIRWMDILKGNTSNTGMVRRFVLGTGVQWMQQLAGINVTSYYLPLVLENSVGLSNSLARLLAACNSVSYFCFAFIGLHLIERAGRRKMMMYGAAGQAICYAFISAFLSQASDPSHSASTHSQFGAAATAFFFLYYVFFGVCWQGIPWLYPVEINSLTMRTVGAAVATGSNWLSNYVVVQVTPPGLAGMGWKFYLIWMTFNAVFVPIVYLFYPETSNRHLEDVDRLYRENEGLVFVFKNKEAVQTNRPEKYGGSLGATDTPSRQPMTRKVTGGTLERRGSAMSAMRRRVSNMVVERAVSGYEMMDNERGQEKDGSIVEQVERME